MCGFVGCFHSGGQALPSGVVERMLAGIRHRGPDDEGLHGLSFQKKLSQRQERGASFASEMDAGFGFARLSIQDLTQAGHQPMSSADGKVVLVFNGEIYNAAKYREGLLAEGAVFHGHSDTEVILRLYERHGWEGLLARIEGMFAIAIADLRTGRLHVARDHFGIKPLYWWQSKDVLLIASEIKAFLAHPAFLPELETDHLAEQLMFRYCAWDRTLLRGVQQLPPGHALMWQPGDAARVQRYWTLPDAAGEGSVDAEELIGTVRRQLREAVRAQLIADVPLGTQLSGGIDSSLVTLAAAGESAAAARLNTFSIVFDDPQVSEDEWIDQAVRKTGVSNHKYLFSPQDFAADFERVTWHLDGPPGNPNTLALHLLAARAKHHVKVLLTGEGCDELFGGYNRFYYTALQQRHPAVFRAGAALGARSRGRLWRLFGQAGASLEHQMVSGSAYGAAAWVERMLPDSKPGDALARRLEQLSGIPGQGIARQIRYEAETYLPDLLLRQDKMTMAHGVECRVPFLDLTLARTARCLPTDWLARAEYGRNARMRGTKRIIKEIATREFDHAFAYRKKRGFDVPLAAFFRQPAIRIRMEEDWMPALKRRGLLDGNALAEQWRVVCAGPGNGGGGEAEALWVAVGLEVWAGQVLDRRGLK
jgi:asparagine synthase (glutamine-hydrolysing)